MAKDCFTRLLDPEVQKQLFGERDVPKELLRRLEKDINDIKIAADSNPELGTFKSRVQEYIKEKRELNVVQQEVRANNLRKTKERLDFYTQEAFQRDPLEALKSILTYSKFLANGGRDSLESRISSMNAYYKNYLLGGLKDLGLDKVALSGKLDREIMIATESIALGETPKGVTQEAIQIAQVVHNINEKFFRDMRDAGVPVRHMPGYIGPQVHDMDKIRAEGFQAWFEKTMPLLDQKRTFGTNAGDHSKMIKSMHAIYKSIISGRVGEDANIGGKEIEDTIMNTGHTRSISNELSESRFLHFEGGDQAYQYNANYGRGSFMESMVQDINKRTKMIAAVQKFGSNPEAAIEADVDRLINRYKKDGNLAAAEKIEKSRDGITNLYNETMGNTSIPSENTLARIGRNIRTVQSLSKLAFAGVRSISNFATAAIEIKTATGQNLFESSLNIVSEWVNSIPASKRNQFARDAGMFLQDMNAEIINAGGGGNSTIGWGARSMQVMFKLNGLEMMSNGMKTAYARVLMTEVGTQVGKEFKDLDPRMQATYLASGIDQTDFMALKSAIQEMPDGRKMVTSEGIMNMDTPELRAVAAAKDMSFSQYQRDLQLKYSGMINSGSNIASTTAGARERNIINGGTFTGTSVGEIRRLIGQFKAFAVQAHFIAQRVLESAPDQQKLMRGELMSQGKDYMSFSQFLIGAGMTGYMGQALIDMAKGDSPKDPRDVGTWVDAFAKGGAGGLYADFLFGQNDKFNMAEGILGPTVGQLYGPGAAAYSSGRDAIVAIADGDKKATRENKKAALTGATRLVRNNIPFQQLPLARQALDYLQYDVIQESLSPGYKARAKLRKMKAAQESGE